MHVADCALLRAAALLRSFEQRFASRSSHSAVCVQGVTPEVGIFNSIIAACAHSGEYAKAQGMFDALTVHACQPDAVTFANLIRAYKKVGCCASLVLCICFDLCSQAALRAVVLPMHELVQPAAVPSQLQCPLAHRCS